MLNSGKYFREIALQVRALRHEQRCYRESRVSRRDQPVHGFAERRLHDLEERKLDYDSGLELQDRLLNRAERRSPLRIARAVREQYQRGPRVGFSFRGFHSNS